MFRSEQIENPNPSRYMDFRKLIINHKFNKNKLTHDLHVMTNYELMGQVIIAE